MNKTFITRLAVSALTLILLGSNQVYAKDEAPVSHRYFIKTEKSIWKKTFNARNLFKGGFTADLSSIQLNIAKFMGIEVQQLPIYQISPLSINSTEATISEKDADKRQIPEDQVPFNISLINQSLKIATGSSVSNDSIKIAVLDTGANTSHPDIKNVIEECRDFTAFNSSIYNNKCADKNGHGTSVASIISSDSGDDGLGMFGVAPGAKLLVYKVCDDSGVCYGDDISVAINLAIENGAKIINLSFGSDSDTDFILEDAIKKAVSEGVFVVSSAGNDGPDKKSIDYPAGYENVISVGAIDNNLNVVSWSSRGTAPVDEPAKGDIDFVAPGNKIQTASIDGGYVNLSGTSLSAPHISGLIAVILNQSIDKYSYNDVIDYLKSIATDLDKKGPDANSGFGLPVFKK